MGPLSERFLQAVEGILKEVRAKSQRQVAKTLIGCSVVGCRWERCTNKWPIPLTMWVITPVFFVKPVGWIHFRVITYYNLLSKRDREKSETFPRFEETVWFRHDILNIWGQCRPVWPWSIGLVADGKSPVCLAIFAQVSSTRGKFERSRFVEESNKNCDFGKHQKWTESIPIGSPLAILVGQILPRALFKTLHYTVQ